MTRESIKPALIILWVCVTVSLGWHATVLKHSNDAIIKHAIEKAVFPGYEQHAIIANKKTIEKIANALFIWGAIFVGAIRSPRYLAYIVVGVFILLVLWQTLVLNV